jgi:hypothetical protein
MGRYGHGEACRLLVLSRADPGRMSLNHKTPLQAAAP